MLAAILEGIEAGEIKEEAREAVGMLLKRSFRPEFLNRLDEIIYFKPLTKENIRSIVDIAVAALSERLLERRLTVTVSPRAREHIIESAYDPIYGARPLKRFLSSNLETLIARKIIAEDIAPESNIMIDYDGALKAEITSLVN